MGVGKKTGGRHYPQLHWSSGGYLCLCTQPLGCHSLSNEQSPSVHLPLCFWFSLSGPCWLAFSDLNSPSLSSQAPQLSLFLTLPLTLSHSLPLFLKSFCFSHMPVLPHRLIFSLPSLLLPGFWSVSLALSGAGNAPPTHTHTSPSAYKPCLIASSLGKISK